MNSELVERVARSAYEQYADQLDAPWEVSNMAKDTWRKVAQAVLAELAGELRDAELARVYRNERDQQAAHAENLLKALTAIHMLAAPADVEMEGKIYRFTPQDPTIWLEAWREMSKRIREIPKAIDEARHG